MPETIETAALKEQIDALTTRVDDLNKIVSRLIAGTSPAMSAARRGSIMITREDSEAVLKAYAYEKDPKVKAANVPVTMDQHKSVQVAFGANELSGTSRRLFEEQSPAMMYAIGKNIIDTAYALITADNFTEDPTVSALVDFDRKAVISMAGALSDRGVPEPENGGVRTLLLKGDFFDALFADEPLVQLAANQQAGIITDGKLPKLHGFSLIRASNLPATGNLAGFGFSKSALVVAGRLPNDYAKALPGVTGGGVTQVIVDPRSGLAVMLTQFVNHQLGKAFGRLAYMFGAGKGQIKAGQRLVSQ